MPDQSLYIPSSTGFYLSGAGEIRLRFYYTSFSPRSETFDSPFEFASELKYNFRQAPDSDKIELAGMRIKFLNKDNIWQTHCGQFVFDDSVDGNIFLDIYRDGVLRWSGMADTLNVKKEDYFYDGSLKYTWVVVPFIDKLSYLDVVTLDDAGIADGDTTHTILTKIAAAADFSLDINNAGQFNFVEPTRQYNMIYNQLYLMDLDADMSCLRLLRLMSIGFGFTFFNYFGNLVLQHRNDPSGSALDVLGDDIKVAKVEKIYPVTYAAAQSTQNYQVYSTWENKFGLPQHHTARFGDGEENANSRQNIIVEATELLSRLYAKQPTAGNDADNYYFNLADVPDRPDQLAVTLSYDYASQNIESGMIMYYIGVLGNELYTVFVDFDDSDPNKGYVLANGHTASNKRPGETCTIIRRSTGFGAYDKLLKGYMGTRALAEILTEGMLGDKTLWAQSKDFRPPIMGFTWEGEYYKLGEISYNFKTGVCTFEGDSMGPTPSVDPKDYFPPHEKMMAAVDDGVHKVPAAQIYDHLRSAFTHLNNAADGTTYLPMIDQNGVKHYVFIKVYKGRALLAIEPIPPQPQSE